MIIEKLDTIREAIRLIRLHTPKGDQLESAVAASVVTSLAHMHRELSDGLQKELWELVNSLLENVVSGDPQPAHKLPVIMASPEKST